MAECVVVGAGGHARVVIATLQRAGLRPVAAVDRNGSAPGRTLGEVEVVVGDEYLDDASLLACPLFIMGVGGSGSNALRVALFERALAGGFEPLSVTDPAAIVSAETLGAGCFIAPLSVVGPGATLGVNVIINTSAVVEHDCQVGDHVHVATGATVCGQVTLGDRCHIGAAAVIRQGLLVGEGAVVGAGASVVKDVAPGAVVAGVPARPLPLPGGSR